jgi:hypothetical protein
MVVISEHVVGITSRLSGHHRNDVAASAAP